MTSPVTRKRIRIDITERWCKGCGICVELCPTKVFTSAPATGKVILSAPEQCTGCGLCELYCPDYAISLERSTRDG